MDGHLHEVPVEVWKEIFAIACSSSSKQGYIITIMADFHYQGHENESESFPIILTHVCSRWRQIVIHCPKLWASINVTRLYNRYPRGGKELVDMYLRNSAPHPLNIQALLYLGMKGQTIWEILTGHSSRFERLLLQFDCSDSNLLPAFRGQNTPFNNLVFFDGADGPPGDAYESPTINHPFWQALRQAPKLREVQMNYLYPRNLLPYQQLTTLAVGSICEHDVEGLLLALEVSKNLHSLTLGAFPASERPLDITPRCVELPSLRTLSVCSYVDDLEEDVLGSVGNPILEVLFASFVLPSLSTFELVSSSSSSDRTHWPPSLLIMLQQSSATLRHMSLSLDFHKTDHFWEPLSVLLTRTPHINHFHLNEESRNDNNPLCLPANFVISFFSDTRQSGNIILPKLVHLALTDIEVTLAIGTMVIATAPSRSPNRLSAVGADAISPLEELRVVDFEFDDDLPEFTLTPHILEAIEGLKRDGVKVVVEKLDW